MDLVDVEESGGSCIAYFGKDDITNGNYQLYFHLKCTQEQATYLLNNTNTDVSKTYAVIARLDKVQMPRIRLQGSGQGDDAHVDIDTSSTYFFASGVCVDLLRKGEIK
jgi:hypothetical protein